MSGSVDLRIALVSWRVSPPFGVGGVARYVYRLANELARVGNEVVVFYAHGYEDAGNIHDRFSAVRIPVSCIPVVRIFQFCRNLRTYLEEGSFDIVNLNTHQFAWGLGNYEAVVLTIHTTSLGERIGQQKGGVRSLRDLIQWTIFASVARAMERCAIRNSKAIIVVNSALSDEISGLNPAYTNKITVIEPAVESESLTLYDRGYARGSLGFRESDFVVLFVGRLDARKNPLALLEGFSQVLIRKRRPLRLVYCGTGTLMNQLKNRVDKLGLADRVSVLGNVDENTLSMIYSAADVFVLPSEIEGFPVTLLECRKYGVPAIVGPFPGVSGIVRDGENGRILSHVSSRSIADALERFVDAPEELRRMRDATKSLDARSKRWEEVAALYNSLFTRILLLGRED